VALNLKEANVLRKLALELPDVEDVSSARGVGFKAAGKLLACEAIHASAEPNTLMVRVSLAERARFLAEHPDACYVTAHYEKHPAVLVRLSRVRRDVLRELLGAAWLFVSEQSASARKTKKRGARKKPRPVALDLRGLSGRDREELFTLSGAVKRDAAVEAWFSRGPAELKSMARKWFERMRRCGSDVRELMHDGCPVACVEDAAFAYVNAFKSHVNVGFYCGAMLEDPAGLLQGSGKRMRHVKLTPGKVADDEALGQLIAAAYAYVRARVRAHRS